MPLLYCANTVKTSTHSCSHSDFAFGDLELQLHTGFASCSSAIVV